MKRIVKAFIVVLIISMVITPCTTVFAANHETSNPLYTAGGLNGTNTYQIGDGYYIKQELISESRNRSVQTYSKLSTVYNSNDVIQCSLKISAIFEFGNGFARCTKAWTTKTIYNDSWTIEDVKCSFSTASVAKASASASFKFVKRFLGIVIRSKTDSLVLTCDKNGIPG